MSLTHIERCKACNAIKNVNAKCNICSDGGAELKAYNSETFDVAPYRGGEVCVDCNSVINCLNNKLFCKCPKPYTPLWKRINDSLDREFIISKELLLRHHERMRPKSMKDIFDKLTDVTTERAIEAKGLSHYKINDYCPGCKKVIDLRQDPNSKNNFNMSCDCEPYQEPWRKHNESLLTKEMDQLRGMIVSNNDMTPGRSILEGLMASHDFGDINGHVKLSLAEKVKYRLRSMTREIKTRGERCDRLRALIQIKDRHIKHLENELAKATAAT